jgi:hypothetical protein
MTITAGMRLRCQNPDCGCEIEVHRASKKAESNPRCCCCGAEMKRTYAKPALRELDDTATEFFGATETIRKRRN